MEQVKQQLLWQVKRVLGLIEYLLKSVANLITTSIELKSYHINQGQIKRKKNQVVVQNQSHQDEAK